MAGRSRSRPCGEERGNVRGLLGGISRARVGTSGLEPGGSDRRKVLTSGWRGGRLVQELWAPSELVGAAGGRWVEAWRGPPGRGVGDGGQRRGGSGHREASPGLTPSLQVVGGRSGLAATVCVRRK